MSAANDAGEFQKITGLAAGARTNVSAVEFDVAQFPGRFSPTGVGMTGHDRFEPGQIHRQFVGKLFLPVAFDRLVTGLRRVQLAAVIHVSLRLRIEFKNAVLATRFDDHVRNGHAVVHRKIRHPRPIKLQRAIGRAVESNLADAMKNDVFGHHTRLQPAFEPEMHGLGHFQQQFARAHHETGVGIADAGGELIEGAGHAGVRIGAEQNFARPRVTFLRQRRVTHARKVRSVLFLELAFRRVERPVTLGIVDHVVKVRDTLLAHEVAQDIDIAVRLRVGGKNVVVRNDHDLVPVPDLCVLAKFTLEHADGARPADIVRHQNVGVHPDVVAGLHPGFARGTRQNFLGQGHRQSSTLTTALSDCNRLNGPK